MDTEQNQEFVLAKQNVVQRNTAQMEMRARKGGKKAGGRGRKKGGMMGKKGKKGGKKGGV